MADLVKIFNRTIYAVDEAELCLLNILPDVNIAVLEKRPNPVLAGYIDGLDLPHIARSRAGKFTISDGSPPLLYLPGIIYCEPPILQEEIETVSREILCDFLPEGDGFDAFIRDSAAKIHAFSGVTNGKNVIAAFSLSLPVDHEGWHIDDYSRQGISLYKGEGMLWKAYEHTPRAEAQSLDAFNLAAWKGHVSDDPCWHSWPVVRDESAIRLRLAMNTPRGQ